VRALIFAVGLTAVSLAVADWPEFRGPGGEGLSEQPDLPLKWSESQNVRWKVPIPGEGWSSPTIFDGRIWITTATDGGRSLRAIALSAETGEILYNTEVIQLDRAPSKHNKNTHASPTPILTKDRIYTHFGRHGTAALSPSGEVLWRNREHTYTDGHGNGGSPVLWHDLLIFNADGVERQSVVALDAETGETRWVARRGSRMSFATPLVIETARGPQLISPGGDEAGAYDPRTGRLIWSIRYDGFSVVPRPVFGHGLVYLTTGFYRPTVYAVRPDGSGDVTASHVEWRQSRGAPLSPSLLLVEDLLYMVSDNGIASCIDAKTGAQEWQGRLGGNFSASPLHAAGRIYFTNETGETTVIAIGPKFRELARNRVDGDTLASLAISGTSIYLRSRTHLYRISDAPT